MKNFIGEQPGVETGKWEKRNDSALRCETVRFAKLFTDGAVIFGLIRSIFAAPCYDQAIGRTSPLNEFVFLSFPTYKHMISRKRQITIFVAQCAVSFDITFLIKLLRNLAKSIFMRRQIFVE